MFKKTFPKYLLIALAIIFCFHFLFTYFNPSVKNPWSIITEDHYIDSGKDAPIINNEKATNNKISTGPRTITKSIFKTKILTMTSTVTVENTIQPTQVQEEEIKQTETFEKEEPTKQETIPPRKAKAAFVVLIRNDDLKSFRYTMVQLEQRFNRKYKYPYVFLNDVPFTEEFMNQTRSLTEANCEFGLIPVEHWSVPSSIDKELMESAMKQMAEERVIYGGSLNYRHMCRFESGFFYRHELLKNYDYYWRVEPGVDFYCNIDFDPFLYMQDNDIKYGFTISLYEYPRTIESLWGTVKEFIEMYPEYIEEDNWMDFVSNDEGATYNLCHFWSNFEIADLRLWRGEAYSKFFKFLDDKVHSIAAALFLKKHQIHYFNEIGYKHNPFMHCPVEEEFRGRCSCDPHQTFDNEEYSCTRLWKSLVEKFNVKVPSRYSLNSTYINN
ncbi:777_t:CDS:2 [Entrophospora sp. SA101]|nr:777_t:CDS:2 [Entrophospora sp. SA101]